MKHQFKHFQVVFHAVSGDVLKQPFCMRSTRCSASTLLLSAHRQDVHTSCSRFAASLAGLEESLWFPAGLSIKDEVDYANQWWSPSFWTWAVCRRELTLTHINSIHFKIPFNSLALKKKVERGGGKVVARLQQHCSISWKGTKRRPQIPSSSQKTKGFLTPGGKGEVLYIGEGW